MKFSFFFCLGLLTAGIGMGAWWMILIGGGAALVLRRAYGILAVGIILDLWYASVVGDWYITGLYTVSFTIIAIVAEFLRGRFVWSNDA